MTVEDFIAKWQGTAGGAETSNFQNFVTDLCEVLEIERPGVAEKGKLGAYEYEATVPHGSFRSLKASGRIDLYKRGHFIMEAKQSYLKPEQTALDLEDDAAAPRAPSGATYDRLMRDARLQVENYARNLPASEPVAPFLIVCDVGRAFELYVDTAGNGRGYDFFPGLRSYRIELHELASEAEVEHTGKTPLELLRAIWTDPKSIDPRHQSALVTRAVASRLAEVSKYLEEGIRIKSDLDARQKNIEIEEGSLFLMRVLFCMFAEDVGLLPLKSFENFLKRAEGNRQLFENGLRDLFEKMNNADPGNRFSMALETDVRYFNGGLFDTSKVYNLGTFLIHDLYEAARQNWRRVEPAIFGTLLEQALDADERSKLGAHYTPRPYVETLVRATIMDVLEPEWARVEEEIDALLNPLSLKGEGGARSGAEGEGVPQANSNSGLPRTSGARNDEALSLAQAFHQKLATTRVLDPACGTGNFLYVAMELLQALESKVIERIQTLGGEAQPMVGPQQFYGLELNPRAAKIAELVLWIGWLRNRLKDDPEAVPEPVLKRSANLNMGRSGRYDAVLRLTETGEPDYENPVLADWPEVDFIVGNPPFIGGKDLRERLGGDYAEAMWKANPRVPKSADFVMQWWDRAAHTLVAEGSPLQRFGFVTTNSITQEFSRRVIAQYLPPRTGEGNHPKDGGGASDSTTEREAGDSAPLHPSTASSGPPPHSGEEFLSLTMAIPDHPWTKATKDAAAVRIAMTVAARGRHEGVLHEVTGEAKLDSDEPEVALASFKGTIWSNLKSGIDLTTAKPLIANKGLSTRGVEFHGEGYKIGEATRNEFRDEAKFFTDKYVKPFIASQGFKTNNQQGWVIDLYKLSERQIRRLAPTMYQHLLRTAQPSRQGNSVDFRRENWWRLALPHDDLRRSTACLNRFVCTMVTAKHRMFSFVDGNFRPDQGLMTIASDSPYVLGVIQSKPHIEWSLSHGGTLEDRPRYNNTKIFDPFPFPDVTEAQRAAIAEIAEELDETRKLAIAETDKLTMTELYNLRDMLRASASGGQPLSDKDAKRATAARAGIVNRLHEQLDSAVADAYGWGAEWEAGALGPSQIVARLVELNHQRAAEEAAGQIRWLRPDYQIPRFAPK